ncbi:MAG: hypothetical protein JRN62_03765 [Nitrososphaerota archaeon]|jgi:hypothetical protein|nr:hypothetical protein [Nitrososphaerota archaeon]MDG6948719.1 hypothetical protein [Nitrososphaerota archaeon]
MSHSEDLSGYPKNRGTALTEGEARRLSQIDTTKPMCLGCCGQEFDSEGYCVKGCRWNIITPEDADFEIAGG